MSLHTLWFIIDAIFWCGFFVLEGFDFGVGMLHRVVGKTDIERRVAVNAIGPFWDGNEVWLIVAGAVIFAAFPSWYATMFSTFYLALVLVLVALMARGVSFEFRGKITDSRWRSAWSWALTIGSALVPLLLGVALGDLLNGLPIDQDHQFTGNFFDLLTPYGLWTGVTFLVLSVLSGANFLALKTTGALRSRSEDVARLVSKIAAAAVIGFVVWSRVVAGGLLPDPFTITAVLAVLAAAWLATTEHRTWAFAASVIAMAGSVATVFIDLYANVMVSSTNAAYNLTVANSSSSSYALKVMTVVAVIFTPIVLLYQGWNYWVFRGRLTAPAQEAAPDPEPGPAATASNAADEAGAQ